MSRPKKRPERVPMSQRNKISFKGLEKGYQYRVINDEDDRLEQAKAAGYEFVESQEKLGDERAAEAGSIDARVSKPVGNGIRGYLMRIRQDWYEEDQLEKQKRIDEAEKAMNPMAQKDFESETYGEGLTNK